MFFTKMRILRLVLKIFNVSKYSTQTIPSEKLPSPLLPDHYQIVVATVFVGAIIFKEKIVVTQWIGVGLIISGISAIAFGKHI